MHRLRAPLRWGEKKVIRMFNFLKKPRRKSDDKRKISIVTYTDPNSVNTEQFRSLRTNIEFVQFERELKSLLITSSIPSEGKSTVAANLAIVMAQTEKKVLLVDADLRKPTLHRTFKGSNDIGLTSLLMDTKMDVDDAIQYRKELNLSILMSGKQPPNPSELLGSERMNRVMEALKERYDLIIYDTPPLRTITDAQILASKVDGVILVSRYEYTRKEEIKQSKETLTKVKANIVGYVMNQIPRSKDSRYDAYYME